MLLQNKSSRPAKTGFTLVELAIVVTIIIALAGIVTPRLTSIAQKADYARAASELKGMKKAVELLYTDVGFFPDDQSRGVDPGLNDPARVPAAVRDDWRGPYLESWPNENPFGGSYDYEYWNRSTFNFDGVAGNEVFIAITDGIDDAMMLRLDEILDDGNLTTGMARRENSTKLILFIGEGPDW